MKKQPTVLIVDDNPENLSFLAELLGKNGCDITLAQDGAMALASIEDECPALILLDIMMPDMNGYEVCEHLKANEQTREIPVIFLSALTDVFDKIKAFRVGGVDYITKPFQGAEVIARIKTHLSLQNLQKRLQAQNQELQQKNELIRRVFGRYLSDEVVNTLLETESGLALGGERRKITILTSDIRGFTAQTNQLPPEQIIEILNLYLKMMADVITHYQGTINEFMGDGILVFFGAPILREKEAERAVACAVAMQLAMTEVNEKVQSMGFAPLEMGIGINTGHVVVGNVGSEKRTKYSAIGNEVILTYRIESYTVGGQIFISESTLKQVRHIIKIGHERTVKPKGITEPITIYDVQGIGGKYNLYLPQEEETWFSLKKTIPLQYTVLEGKHVSDQVLNGQILKLSVKGALIACEVEPDLVPEPLENIKLNLLIPGQSTVTEDIYAKVLSKKADDYLFLRFTGISLNITQQLATFLKDYL
jgi:class 3 adenylate cyclase